MPPPRISDDERERWYRDQRCPLRPDREPHRRGRYRHVAERSVTQASDPEHDRAQDEERRHEIVLGRRALEHRLWQRDEASRREHRRRDRELDQATDAEDRHTCAHQRCPLHEPCELIRAAKRHRPGDQHLCVRRRVELSDRATRPLRRAVILEPVGNAGKVIGHRVPVVGRHPHDNDELDEE